MFASAASYNSTNRHISSPIIIVPGAKSEMRQTLATPVILISTRLCAVNFDTEAAATLQSMHTRNYELIQYTVELLYEIVCI